MKLFRMLGRNFRDALKSVIRNFSLSIASISCITITLIVVSFSMIASYNVNNFTKLIKKDVTIVVFLDKDIKTGEVSNIEQTLRLMENVDSYSFKSKNEVKESMQASSETFSKIMSKWSEKDNPLQDTFLVKVLEIEKIKDTVDKIRQIPKVSVVKYGEGMIDQLISVFKAVEKGTMGLVIALVVVTAFLISNTIKLTIFSRKREISIMRLVGASNITIKIPFIIEGLFLGLIGAIVPIIVTIYGYYTLYDYFDGKLFSPFIRLVSPEPFVYGISLILLFIGMLVGMLGSSRAVRKHLKV
jgi:cell division transport system permease protein